MTYSKATSNTPLSQSSSMLLLQTATYRYTPPRHHELKPSRHYGTTVNVALRSVQLVLAFATAGLYGAHLVRATHRHERADPSFVYAEVVAALSILTCVTHCASNPRRTLWALWDFVLCVLWAALFGVFGTMCFKAQRTGEAHTEDSVDFPSSDGRMKAAVWIDVISMVLWGLTFLHTIVCCCGHRTTVENASELERLAETQETRTEARAGGLGEKTEKAELV